MDLSKILTSDMISQISATSGKKTTDVKNVLENAIPMLLDGDDSKSSVAKKVSKQTGISATSISDILEAAAPLITKILAGGLGSLDSDGDGKIDLGGVFSALAGTSTKKTTKKSSKKSQSGSDLLGGILGGLLKK
ncbi:MAG: hypothetical protein KBS79_03715 [Lachnospiraceae bacterium]|nr:hypothetical protein [Candidatus Minthocola equi]